MNTALPVTVVPSLVPTSMSEAMKLAEMMATAKLVPKDLQKSPADCLMVILQAVRWNMDPFAVAQECSVIQGKIMYSGKLVAAVVNARGNLSKRLSFTYAGTGDDRTITVSGHLQGETHPRTVSVILRNARTSNVQWQKQPDQQLMYHASRVWARRHKPELMLGINSEEEFSEQDDEDDDPPPPLPEPPHDPDTGEIPNLPSPSPPVEPHQIAVDPLTPNWHGFATEFYRHVKRCTTNEATIDWEDKNNEQLAALWEADQQLHDKMMAAVNKHRDSLATEAAP
jgi:hypothetical protein